MATTVLYTDPALDVVIGPDSATDGAVVQFDGTTGRLVKNSGVRISAEPLGSNVNVSSGQTQVVVGNVHGFPGIWFGNVTPSVNNYNFLYVAYEGVGFNTVAGESIFFRIQNTGVAEFTGTYAKLAAAVDTPAGGSAAASVRLGTTATLGIYYGSGAPSVLAAKGSLYLRSDGDGVANRAYINTDSGTTWTALTTAA